MTTTIGSRGEEDGTEGSSRRLSRDQGFVEKVLQIIRADILSLHIPPDTRISIDKYARELGISQTPVREALSMLEAVGLVTKRLYIGYCSSPQLTRKQLDEVFEVRLLLEPFAARRAADCMSEQAMATLRDIAVSMRSVASAESYDSFAQLDGELHDLIADECGNDIVRDALARLHVHLHIFRLRSNTEVTQEALQEHELVIEALAGRNADAAEAAMRDHINRSYGRLAAFARD